MKRKKRELTLDQIRAMLQTATTAMFPSLPPPEWLTILFDGITGNETPMKDPSFAALVQQYFDQIAVDAYDRCISPEMKKLLTFLSDEERNDLFKSAELKFWELMANGPESVLNHNLINADIVQAILRISSGELADLIVKGHLQAYRLGKDLDDIVPVVDLTNIAINEVYFKYADVEKCAKKRGLPRRTPREKDKEKVMAWATETDRKHPNWTYEKMIEMAKRSAILQLSRIKRLSDDSIVNDYPPSFFTECFREAGIRKVGWQKGRRRKPTQHNM